MARCGNCEKSGFFLSIKGGLCATCFPIVEDEVARATDIIRHAAKAGERAKTIDAKVSNWERVLQQFERFLELEKKGVAVRPFDLETGEPVRGGLEEYLRGRRRTLDGFIVDALEEQAHDAKAKADATTSKAKKRTLLERALERIRYFKTKMHEPERVLALEDSVSRAMLVVATCVYCGKLRGVSEQCESCGASNSPGDT